MIWFRLDGTMLYASDREVDFARPYHAASLIKSEHFSNSDESHEDYADSADAYRYRAYLPLRIRAARAQVTMTTTQRCRLENAPTTGPSRCELFRTCVARRRRILESARKGASIRCSSEAQWAH